MTSTHQEGRKKEVNKMEDNVYTMMERMIDEFKTFVEAGKAPQEELELADIVMNDMIDYLTYNEGI